MQQPNLIFNSIEDPANFLSTSAIVSALGKDIVYLGGVSERGVNSIFPTPREFEGIYYTISDIPDFSIEAITARSTSTNEVLRSNVLNIKRGDLVILNRISMYRNNIQKLQRLVNFTEEL